jgi:hypothetical protein
LKNLKELQSLRLWLTDVTQTGIDELKKAIPGLDVSL